MLLTDVIARNAKPTGKTRKLSDERGLYLEVSPTGSKWWRLKYRFDGKEKRLALGVYPDVGLKHARERRDIIRRLGVGVVQSECIDLARPSAGLDFATPDRLITGTTFWRHRVPGQSGCLPKDVPLAMPALFC